MVGLVAAGFSLRECGRRLKMLTLDGKTVLEIPGSAIPDQFKNAVPANTKKNAKGEIAKNPDEGKRILRMTAMDVAPNGDLYVTDGYASDYIHRFDRAGKYLASFGGKKEPYGFKTLHKIAIDTRFTPARIIGVDREGRRVVHVSLEGEFIGVAAKGGGEALTHVFELRELLAIEGDRGSAVGVPCEFGEGGVDAIG